MDIWRNSETLRGRGFLTIIFCILRDKIPHVTCHEVWHLATAWQSCAHGLLARCPVKTQILKQLIQSDQLSALSANYLIIFRRSCMWFFHKLIVYLSWLEITTYESSIYSFSSANRCFLFFFVCFLFFLFLCFFCISFRVPWYDLHK